MMSNLGHMSPSSDSLSKQIHIFSSIDFEETEEDTTGANAAAKDSMISVLTGKLHIDSGKSVKLPVPNVEYAQLSNIISRMFASFGFPLVNTDSLKRTYRQLLAEKKIHLPFELYTDSLSLITVKNHHEPACQPETRADAVQGHDS